MHQLLIFQNLCYEHLMNFRGSPNPLGWLLIHYIIIITAVEILAKGPDPKVNKRPEASTWQLPLPLLIIGIDEFPEI